MTWSYTVPANGTFAEQAHHVRFLMGDTAKIPQSLQDEEIEFIIAEWQAANPTATDVDMYQIASTVAYAVADRYAGLVSGGKSAGDSSLNRYYNGEMDRWRAVAARLGLKAVGGGASALSGMGLVDDGRAAIFRTHQMDNGRSDPGTVRGDERLSQW